MKSGDAYKLSSNDVVIARAKKLIAAGFRPGATEVSKPSQEIEFLTVQLGGSDDEVFAVMLLDTQNRFIVYDELFRGTADTTNVCVRHVMSRVVQSRATAIICAHDHPSGAAVPSRADIGITANSGAHCC
jgi:DNA repair protein RadC